MTPTNDRIIVYVDSAQKHSLLIGDVMISLGLRYENNRRERNPVIAEVMQGNDRLSTGILLLCHHNHFERPSPYHLYDELYSIPANHTIFAILCPDGTLSPVYGNVLASKMWVKAPFPVPPEERICYKDRGVILDGGWTDFQAGDLVFTRPSAIYEIVYNVGGQEKRVCKIDSKQICACVKKK